ncbi:MAG: DUF2339 domain-containing protein [Oscillospiraceae bacterium]|nr:DUF2339 domain-containing protein [Oscillospiraceae bacterium]
MEILIIPALVAITVWVYRLSSKIQKQEKIIIQLMECIERLYGELDVTPGSGKTVPVEPAVSSVSTVPAVPVTPVIPVAPVIPAVSVSEKSAVPEIPVKRGSISFENWLGRNAVGIAASVLVFTGIIFLGVLVYEYLTDAVKIALMYAISFLITFLGIVLTLKKQNTFTAILTGCGCGSIFISVLITHAYFGYIGDMASFSMLAVWMGASLYLAKRINSLLISIISHTGMVISICFALTAGINDEKTALVLIYQAVSTAVIIMGNILCFKKTYRLGLIISLALSVTASAFMAYRFTGTGADAPFAASSINTAGLAAAFILQFLCASFLSYLLAAASTRLENKTFMILVHILNKILWLVSLFINISHTAYRIFYVYYHSADQTPHTFQALYPPEAVHSAMRPAVGITTAFLVLHAVFSVFMNKKYNFNAALEKISVLAVSGAAGVLFLNLWDAAGFAAVSPRLTLLIVIGLILIAAGILFRRKAYIIGGNVFIALDALFMIFGGYGELEKFGSIALPLGYLAVYIAVIRAQLFFAGPVKKSELSPLARILSLAIAEISLISIFMQSSLQYKGTILLLVLTAVNCLFYVLKFDHGGGGVLRLLLWINAHIIIAISCICISFVYKDRVLTVLYLLLAVFTFCLAFMRSGEILKGGGGLARELLFGLKISGLTLAVIRGNTNWFDHAYVFSLVFMLTALICIAAGFFARAKTLRLYGLVVTFVCVLKLVTADVSGLNTVLRVVSLIGGGGICFVISALYNYSVKKFKADKLE